MSKKRLKDGKSRGRQPRKVATREVRQRFLIVCEGKRTEFFYFKAFQVPGLVVQVEGIGESTVRLIEEVQHKQRQGVYDQTWCVFDRDDCVPEHVHSAIAQAEDRGYRVAFSNQAFELWYLLHFHYYHTALSRHDYCDHLSRLLGHAYKKECKSMYAELLSQQETAIDNARRLYCSYQPWDPIHCDPSTTVYLLVEELNKHRRP